MGASVEYHRTFNHVKFNSCYDICPPRADFHHKMILLSASCQSSFLKLAVVTEALAPQLATLLALQRAEEPETVVLLQEVDPRELFNGLEDGIYDMGMALTMTTPSPALNPHLLWADELALAVPSRSPLLAHPEVPLDALQHYPLFRWHPQACDALSQQLDALCGNEECPSQEITSFEHMAVLVAAGYGVGLAPRSRVVQARSWGVTMRPLANGPYFFRIQLLPSSRGWTPAVKRFSERAAKVAANASA